LTINYLLKNFPLLVWKEVFIEYLEPINRMTARIQILLSTYNGDKFLPEQLASLDAQEGPKWSLFWRDDGSSDSTVALMRQHPRALELDDDKANLGPAHSFQRLLAAAPGDAAAFAFCDQDDVWMPSKLARAWSWLASQPSARPALYFSRQNLVDVALKPIGLSPKFRKTPSFQNALAQNIATGCTIMMNAAARNLIRAAPPLPKGSMHDWWAYLLVSGAGGIIYADPQPTLLYRQHNKNAVGAPASTMQRASGVIRRGSNQFLDVFDANLCALEAAGNLLTDNAREIVALLRPLWGLSPMKRLSRLAASGLYRQAMLEDLVLRSFVLLGRTNKETRFGLDSPPGTAPRYLTPAE